MKANLETLEIIMDRSNNQWARALSKESVSIIKSKINEIPSSFYEPRIVIDEENDNRISLIEFSRQIATMSTERKKYLMQKYHINAYDMDKLQSIINSIKVVKEYGTIREENKKLNNDEKVYGIALSKEKNLDKAYPLWLAYLYSDSKNPMQDIKNRLKEDGKEDRYTPEYVVSLIEHTNSLLEGKPENEKKDFYIRSISSILDEDELPTSQNKKMEIEI